MRQFANGTEHLVATARALYREGPDGDWLRIAWPAIAVVGWSRAQHVITLRLWPSAAVGDEIRVPGDAALAAFADERVAATRLLLTQAEIRPGLIASVAGLRDPDDGTVRWRVLVDGQDVAGDPAFREGYEQLLADLRQLAGY